MLSKLAEKRNREPASGNSLNCSTVPKKLRWLVYSRMPNDTVNAMIIECWSFNCDWVDFLGLFNDETHLQRTERHLRIMHSHLERNRIGKDAEI